MASGKENVACCTGGFRTTPLASPSPVKECKFLNDAVRYICGQTPEVRQYEGTLLAVCRFHYRVHVTFLLELGSLRDRSVDLCSSIAWLNITLKYFYIFSQLTKSCSPIVLLLAL